MPALAGRFRYKELVIAYFIVGNNVKLEYRRLPLVVGFGITFRNIRMVFPLGQKAPQ